MSVPRWPDGEGEQIQNVQSNNDDNTQIRRIVSERVIDGVKHGSEDLDNDLNVKNKSHVVTPKNQSSDAK